MPRASGYRQEMAAAADRLARPTVDVRDVATTRGVVRCARYGSGRPVLFVHGSGGGWDQGVAADHPDRVRRLVLESPLIPVAGRAAIPPLPMVRLLARAQRVLWLTTRLPPVVRVSAGAPPGGLSGADRAELAAINGTMFPLEPRRTGMLLDRTVTAPYVLADRIPVEHVSAPTLVINAAHAVLAPHGDMVRFVNRLPDAELVEPERGGHVLVGNVAPLRDAVRGFLTR